MKRDGPATATLVPIGQGAGIKLDKTKLQASNDNNYNFQSARLNVGVSGGGRWYHEITIDAGGGSQQLWFGYALAAADVSNGQQLGFNELSWGWDGSQRMWAGKAEQVGDGKIKQCDVIGMSLDLDSRKVYATRNGKPAGVIFVDMPRDHLLYPALSMRRNQKVTFNLGASPFRYADKLAFPWHSMLDDKQKMGLEKLYEHYKRIGSELSESGEDHGDVIKADGVFQFATDAGAADDSDPLLLVMAHKLHCEHPWELSREEWMRGFSLFGLHDIVSIKTAAARWKQETLSGDAELFKNFYCWTFDYLRDDRKILTMDEAKTLWSMLGMAARWKQWKQWLDFLLIKKKREYISRDEYCVVLTFLTEHPNGVEGYDPDGPWPVLIDDFVQFCSGGDDN